MKPFKTKQIFSLVLTVIMLFGLLPGGVTVNAETPNQITVSFAAYDGVNGVYLFAPQALTVTEGIAEQNDFANSAEHIKDTDISALDALVAAHLAKGFPVTDITNAGTTTGMFGQRGAAIGFVVNNLNPVDENSRGYGMNEYALKDGDSVLFYIYGDEYWGDYLSYFDQKELNVKTNEEFTLNLKGHSAMEQMWGTPGSPTPEIKTRINIPYASISVVDKESGEMGPGLMYNGADVLTDEDGNFTYAFSEPGEYILSATGFVESDFGDVPIVAPTCRVTVTAPPAPLPDYTGDWINFRGNDQNMGITGAQTPTTAEEAELKWGVKYATGFFANITPPIILNGDLYIAKNNTVLRLDKETGEMLAQSEALEGSLGFALNPITYGGGLIYVQIGTGRVQALRADTLESVWVSKPLASTEQTLSPITYRNGYIYTGTWGRQTGNYFCISVEDEDPGNPTEEKDHVWTLESPDAGFYWAGAYATDNYVIFGSDAGVLYSVHPTTGEVIDTIEGIRGEIRSTVSYDADTDRIYFSSKAGDFCQVKVNDDGTFDDSLTKIFDVGGMCTGTPLVYNGLAYIGMGGPDQFSPDGGHDYKIIDVNATPMKQVGRAEIPGYVQTSALFSTAYAESKGKVYVYCTYNAQPGGIYVIEVEKTNQTDADGAAVVNVSGSHLFRPQSPMANYCVSSLVCDSEGTLYYKNDSGYIMAVGRKADVPQPSAPLALSASGESVELVETALTGEDFTGNSTISGKIYKAVVPRDAAAVTMTADADLYAAASASMEGAAKRVFEGGKIDVERAKFGSYVLDKQNPKYFNAEKLAGEVLTTQKVLYLSFFETEESYGAKEAAFGLLLQFGDGSEGALPTVTINAPAQTDTGARFSGAELPASFTVDSETRQVKLSVDSWNENAYDFAGWSINGGAPAAEFKITQDTAGWEDYVDGDFTLQALGSNQFECTFNSPVLLQNITIEPVFEAKGETAYQITLVQTAGGEISRVRKTGETHVLSAAADNVYKFVRWEASVDGQKTWTAVEGLGAEGEVTLTQDTAYRAVFEEIKISLSPAEEMTYALTSNDEEPWYLNTTVTLDTPVGERTKLLVKVYEGETENEANLLGTTEAYVGKNASTAAVQAAMQNRPASATSPVLLTVQLEGAAAAAKAPYTLHGTLDASPAAFEVDTLARLFVNDNPDDDYVQLSAAGADAVTWSGGLAGSSNSCAVDQTGKVTFTRFYRSDRVPVTFTASAGDGRVAYSVGTFHKGTGNAIKFNQPAAKLPVNANKTVLATGSTTAISAGTVTLTSSNPEVVRAEFATKVSGRVTDAVEGVKLTGLQKGVATVSMTIGDYTASCVVTVQGDEPVEAVTLSSEAETINATESVQLLAEVLPETADVDYVWLSSDAAVATVDENGLVTAKSAGSATITVKVTDFAGTVKTASCLVTVKDDPYKVTVYAPEGANVAFYPTTGFGADNRDQFDLQKQILPESKKTEGGYHVYSLTLPRGTYSFRGTDALGRDVGGMSFQVPAEQTGGGTSSREDTKIYLRLAEFTVTNEYDGQKAGEEDFAVTVQSKSGVSTTGGAYEDNEGYTRYPALLYANGNAQLYYFTLAPSAAYA